MNQEQLEECREIYREVLAEAPFDEPWHVTLVRAATRCAVRQVMFRLLMVQMIRQRFGMPTIFDRA